MHYWRKIVKKCFDRLDSFFYITRSHSFSSYLLYTLFLPMKRVWKAHQFTILFVLHQKFQINTERFNSSLFSELTKALPSLFPVRSSIFPTFSISSKALSDCELFLQNIISGILKKPRPNFPFPQLSTPRSRHSVKGLSVPSFPQANPFLTKATDLPIFFY